MADNPGGLPPASDAGNDAAMKQVSAELKQLNLEMARQKLEKEKTVKPAATANQAAGNAS